MSIMDPSAHKNESPRPEPPLKGVVGSEAKLLALNVARRAAADAVWWLLKHAASLLL